jgi:RNA polymerase sigma-70 factor (ECF subfamily)
LGAEPIARFLVAIRPNIPAQAEYHLAHANGDLAVVVRAGAATLAVATFRFEGDRISGIFSVSNPDKLRHVSGQPVT